MRGLLGVAAALCLVGCIGWGDMDPFGVTERAIVGRYRLKQWEDERFYLLTPADTGAVLHADAVERLGWDRAHVVVPRAGAGGEAGGWAVIDVATGRIRAPLSATEMAADPSVARIATLRADSAWVRLGSRRPDA